MKPTFTIDTLGNKEWWLNGQLHREDGPAVFLASGTKIWYLNGKLHREDGPAVERAGGHKEWWLNGEVHREDGHAVECEDGTKFWYLNSIQYTKEKFLKKLKCRISSKILVDNSVQ